MIEIRALKNDDNLNDLIPLSKEFFLEYEANHSYFFKTDWINETDIISYFKNFIDNENRKTFIALEQLNFIKEKEWSRFILHYWAKLKMNNLSFISTKNIFHIK